VRGLVKVVLTLEGAGDKVRFELQRRLKSGEWQRVKRLGSKRLKPRKNTFELAIPPQRPGSLRLVAIGPANSAIAPLKVR
jgi:hypothetical protein